MAAGPDGDARRTAPERESYRWVRLRSVWRLLYVLYRFLPLLVAFARDRRRFLLFGGRREVTSEARVRRARRLLETFLDLGPAFIKLGQILSTRPDVLPGEYIAVLSDLQDRVPPDPWAEVEPRIEAELGPVADVFDDFDTDPISGASLGQVYTASVDGQRVAVKVLRPGVRRRVEADLRVIDTLVPVLLRYAPPAQAYTMENVADEFAAGIREEMDYAHEGAMLERVRANFADDPKVVVPRALDSHSTDRVLTMEYVEGTKITDVEALDRMGIDRSALVQRLEETYIDMIIDHGVFHADPHPGNLAVQPDGAIVFYDFGITGRIGPALREDLLDFYLALAREDVDGVIDAFVSMGALDPTANRDLMREVFDIAIGNFRGEDLDEYRIEQLLGEFQEQLYEFPLRLPQNLALIVRVTTVLEGVARTLDPEFDFIDVITDYVRERQGLEGGRRLVEERLRANADQARRTAESTLRVPPRLEAGLDRANEEELAAILSFGNDERLARRLAARTVGAMVAGSGAVAAGILWAGQAVLAAQAVAVVTVLFAVFLWWRFRQKRGLQVTPQFTRQSMRQRTAMEDGEGAPGGDAAPESDD
jgi:predicted unusual protein kinase regulating ubiquinone biosynthesis (AarF/ABC1/UbiB family)